MTQTKQSKIDKRANALRDNLKRRKLKDKAEKTSARAAKEAKDNKDD